MSSFSAMAAAPRSVAIPVRQIHRRMLPVLHLHPVLRPASLIGAVTTLRHQTFKAHAAGSTEEIRTNFTTLEWVDEDAFRPSRQQPFKIGLAHRQWQ
jgi:hypothetical protein